MRYHHCSKRCCGLQASFFITLFCDFSLSQDLACFAVFDCLTWCFKLVPICITAVLGKVKFFAYFCLIIWHDSIANITIIVTLVISDWVSFTILRYEYINQGSTNEVRGEKFQQCVKVIYLPFFCNPTLRLDISENNDTPQNIIIGFSVLLSKNNLSAFDSRLIFMR